MLFLRPRLHGAHQSSSPRTQEPQHKVLAVHELVAVQRNKDLGPDGLELFGP